MTTKEGAVYGFLSSFGIPAYADTSIPSNADFPYLSYQLATGAFGDGEVNVTVSLWYYTDSEAEPNAKVREISKKVGRGGYTVPCEEGFVWVKRGSPFAQAVEGEGDNDKIKRRYINLDLEFFTED